MKISYKNTALGLIDDPKNFYFGFPDPDITPSLNRGELLDFAHSIINSSDALKKLCGSNIQYVSQPFLEAFAKGKHKLAAIFDKEEIEEGGVLIVGGFTPPFTHVHTYYYYVQTGVNDEGKWGYNVLFMDFSKHSKATEHALDVYIGVNQEYQKSLIYNEYLKYNRDTSWWESFIIAFVLFKKYCDVEVKEVEGNRKTIVAGNKYVNETSKRIKILDCSWFTTLIRSGAFEVDGHLHWYWTGPNRSIKRLRWVSTYEKQGYTRQAKVLNQNQNK